MKRTISTQAWNAELNSDICNPNTNADLTIILKLAFREINPSGGATNGTYHDYGDPSDPSRKIIKWTPGAWASWTKHLVSSAQRYWTDRFWLINNFPVLEFEARGMKYRPNLFCRLKIVQANVPPTGPIDAHHVIDVVRLDTTETWFGSHSTLYDSRDTRWVQKHHDSSGHPIMQRAHVHEIGHLLGLGHVDEGKPHCPKDGNTNAAVCYGVTDVDKRSVMGDGMARTPNLGLPWRRAAVQLTGKGSAGSPGDWRPVMIRQSPHTTSKVAAGLRHVPAGN